MMSALLHWRSEKGKSFLIKLNKFKSNIPIFTKSFTSKGMQENK